MYRERSMGTEIVKDGGRNVHGPQWGEHVLKLEYLIGDIRVLKLNGP